MDNGNAEGGGDKPGASAVATGASGRSPVRQQQQQQHQPRGEGGSTMDSSGRARRLHGGPRYTRGCVCGGGLFGEGVSVCVWDVNLSWRGPLRSGSGVVALGGGESLG